MLRASELDGFILRVQLGLYRLSHHRVLLVPQENELRKCLVRRRAVVTIMILQSAQDYIRDSRKATS